MKVGSLFAGIGGFDLAAEWMGWRTIWQSEIDPYCVALLRERFPAARQLGDITSIKWGTVERPDIITGGFPCQDISYAGKGAGLAGARSGLWYEYARAIREMEPRYVVVENVRALFTRGFDAVLGTLADLGYDAEWAMYGASDVGAPHRRQRTWILAYRDGERLTVGAQFDSSTEARREAVHGGRHADRCDGQVGNPEGADGWSELETSGTGIGRAGLARAGARLVNTEHAGLEGLAGYGDDGNEPGRVRTVAGRPVAASGAIVGGGWRDGVTVRGHDGTVRIIPREAADQGPESALWPVADGLPGRVARLRGIGNAIVPACALPIYRRIEEIEREPRGA